MNVTGNIIWQRHLIHTDVYQNYTYRHGVILRHTITGTERERELSNQLTVNQPTGSPNHQQTHQVANETQASVYLVAATNSISWSGQTMTKLNERGVVAMVRLMEVQTDKSWQTEGAVEKTSTSRSYCSRKGTRLLTTSMYHFLGVIFCQ